MVSDLCRGHRPHSSPHAHHELDAGGAHGESCGAPMAEVMLSVTSQEHPPAPSTVTARGPPARVPGGRGWQGTEVSRGHLDSVAADLGQQLRRRGWQQDLGRTGSVLCPVLQSPADGWCAQGARTPPRQAPSMVTAPHSVWGAQPCVRAQESSEHGSAAGLSSISPWACHQE